MEREETVASNPVTCSNCGTENPPGQDFCTDCDQPLTASADQGLRESEEAQDHGGVIGGDAVGPAGAAAPLTSDADTIDGEMRPLR